MPELATSLAIEVFKSGLTHAIHRLQERRLLAAKEILLGKLEVGQAFIEDAADIDEAAAMIFEYATAAQRGTARLNLNLMAQILAGEVQAPPIYADRFLRWSSLLASLSREEVIALTIHRKIKYGSEEKADKKTPAS